MLIKTNRMLQPSLTVNGRVLTNANGDIDTALGGYEYIIGTLSEIAQDTIEQKFYTVPFADYVPVDVGSGAYRDEIVRNLTFQTGGSFFDGDINTNQSTGRMADVDVAMAPSRMPIVSWAKQLGYSIIDLAQAAGSSNWDLLAAKMESLKTDWDLGLQETAFLGHPSKEAVTGLLNDDEVNSNTALISKEISKMSSTEFQTFVGGLLGAYFENSNNTESSPDTFLVPTSDYLGLVSAASDNNPSISKLEYLKKALSAATGNVNFQVKQLAYCSKTRNVDRGINKNRYVLYKNSPKTLKMSIPVDFLLQEAGTSNNFNWVQAAYGQYSGVLITRKREVLYFDLP